VKIVRDLLTRAPYSLDSRTHPLRKRVTNVAYVGKLLARVHSLLATRGFIHERGLSNAESVGRPSGGLQIWPGI
jgi:hypothetical protein